MSHRLLQRPALRGANATRSRDHNRQMVLGQLHARGALGRAEIARRSGLTTQAVSNIIAELEKDGLLLAAGAARGRRGLPATQYVVNPSGGYALGIELRPAAILVALLDLSGELVWQERQPLSCADPESVAAILPGLRDAALSKVPKAKDRLLGAGIVMPGPFGKTELSGRATDLPGWKETDPATLLSDVLDLPVIVENDANAAAMAERIALAAEGMDSFACLYFGTGLGLGIVQDGRIVAGAYGNAGEIGQLPVKTDGGLAPLESVLSRAALERHLAGHGIGASEIQEIARLHESGAPALQTWMAEAASALSQALAVIENLLDPRATVLCGAMPEALLRDLVVATPLPRTVSRRADGAQAPLRIGTCSRMAAARGGAALVLAQSFTPALAA
ncbi:ROK family protein [Aestuariibius sp. 2305UL40-4]|uniref:ROK family transcriptional regulator n=1 Tax=Aestuariibius violaceus TaxID=3234132 RepID=UPI00345E223E